MSLPALRDLIAKYFTLKEIDALCLDLSIEYEELPGTTRTEKAQSLILTCLRRGQLPALEKRCRQLRGHVNWPETAALATAGFAAAGRAGRSAGRNGTAGGAAGD